MNPTVRRLVESEYQKNQNNIRQYRTTISIMRENLTTHENRLAELESLDCDLKAYLVDCDTKEL